MSDLPGSSGMFGWIILTILGMSTVIFVADSVGILPKFIQNFIYRNRSAQTIQVLADLGFNVGQIKRNNRAAKVVGLRTSESLEESAKSLTSSHEIKESLRIGRVDAVQAKSFIDLMGATCNPNKAIDAAQQLSSLWRNIISDSGEQTIPDFDFVVGIKAGSPLIAYEFAKLHKKPLVLHNENLKFQSEVDSFVSRFDAESIPTAGSIALMVDDSTTGGRKAAETVEHLRDAGYEIHDCLVIFEPQTKKAMGRNAAARLRDFNVRLHSIIETE